MNGDLSIPENVNNHHHQQSTNKGDTIRVSREFEKAYIHEHVLIFHQIDQQKASKKGSISYNIPLIIFFTVLQVTIIYLRW